MNSYSTYVEDLEQDPFDAIDFVERLAWRMTSGSETVDEPLRLKQKFEEEISSLQVLCEQFQQKINTMEHEFNEEKGSQLSMFSQLHEQNAEAIEKLKQLDSTMQLVSGKIVHLGEQLESVNSPRVRAHEALQLIRHFDEFLSDQPLSSPVFTDPDKLLESADVIHKLHAISQELSRDRYAGVQARITARYDEVERLLIDEFVSAHRAGNMTQMAAVAKTLSDFKGYAQCVDSFVEHLQLGAFRGGPAKFFDEALALCRDTQPVIEAIFPQPQQVMAKLVLNLFHGKLQETLTSRLSEETDSEQYLVNLAQLYSSTQKLCAGLSGLRLGGDSNFLPSLTRSVFHRHLDAYQKAEMSYLHAQCKSILQRFYESKKHVKKTATILSGGLHELKRDVQARLLTVETYGGETFLSEEVAISILQETKNAAHRCTLLCEKGEAPRMAEQILDVLLQYLYQEHLDYAVELALAGISLAEPKTEPPHYFYSVLQQNAAIVHLLVKQFDDSILPLIRESLVETPCVKKKEAALRSLENKVNVGLDRQLNATVGYVRFVLASQQQKSDFRPDDERINACTTAVRFITSQAAAIRECCDGGNQIAVLSELAARLHKTILNHIQNFVYSSLGAMQLLCDVAEYRKCVSSWRTGDATAKAFEGLHSLCNLLVVLPDNLADAAQSLILAETERSLIQSFLQLRQDYKSLKVNAILF